MDFLNRFNEKLKQINEGKIVRIKPRIYQLSNVKLYRLVTVYNNKRKIIACGLSRYEAGILQRHIERKLSKTHEPDGTGKSLFEVTLVLIEEQN